MNSNIVVKSGIITSNEEWKGNVLISDDLLIPSGVRILIKPNTKVVFLQKSKNKLFNKYLKINYLIEKYNLNREQYRDKISIVVYGTIICEGRKQNLINIIDEAEFEHSIYTGPGNSGSPICFSASNTCLPCASRASLFRQTF